MTCRTLRRPRGCARRRRALPRVAAGRSARALPGGVPRPAHDAGGVPDLVGRPGSSRPAVAPRAHRLRSAEPRPARCGWRSCWGATPPVRAAPRRAEARLPRAARAICSCSGSTPASAGSWSTTATRCPRSTPTKLAREAGITVHRVVRIEPVIARLRERAASYAALEDAFSSEIEQACSDNAVAIKSVIAYRTGLDVQEWPRGRGREHLRALGRGRLSRDPGAGQAGARRPPAAHARDRQDGRTAGPHPLRRRRSQRRARIRPAQGPVPDARPAPRPADRADPLRLAVARGGRIRRIDPARASTWRRRS